MWVGGRGRMAQELEVRRADVQAGLVRDAPVLAAKIAKVGKLKEMVEKALPPLFSGRKIHVIGEINNVLRES